ncbi:NAD-dependent epimerase/dehydratase [Melioribacter roseus P3M-2]|uniref:NAD-dependent epimerase/dehydratase n=1 Tax=Melioribacter roseus (strain DSM 23840 / JCM 17771 / VKM B-2668 / P3M-2) TaxID=1191523 RepID=I7A7L5_MELRP|nr:SDR family oxidoreductase [Melioribacter roseus]AFN75861.1 NAD-dependent epimerase/dehydratase [Melioribacter roseus P3M-2]
MKILFIGGAGNISASVSRQCIKKGYELYLLNRGQNSVNIDGAKHIKCDINNLDRMKELLKEHYWDSVVNWIAFDPKDVERDIELFEGKTKQYIFISSASAYQKPPLNPVITESTPLRNPYWDYSRNKIACEELLNKAYRDKSFPAVVVRPSHTYSNVIPVPIGGWTEYTIVDRIKKGLPIIVHGDGSSLWTVTHADDFAIGFTGLIGNLKTIGHAFHITSDEALSWDQIHYYIADAVGAAANIVHIPSDFIVKCEPSLEGSLLGDKTWTAIFDNSKIKSFVPEFKATIPFQEGIKKTLKWFEEKPERMIVKKETNEMIDRIIGEYIKIGIRE